MQAIVQDTPFVATLRPARTRSASALWSGRFLSGFAALFLIVDGIGKLLRLSPYVNGTADLGYPPDLVVTLGVIELSCVLVYLVPRTAPLGVVLLTGYLGGAVATHVRHVDPLFTHVLAPIYFAAMLWGGLALRDARLRAFARGIVEGDGAEGTVMTTKVRSKDGTMIAYEKSGSGPAVILVDGAFCSRAFGPSQRLAKALAPRFTVYAYDRRGRNQSDDTESYAPEREIEDIAALIKEAGGSSALVGLSSGAALSLEAAAAGLPIKAVVAYEPPYVDEAGDRHGAAHEARLKQLLGEGNRGGAVKYFMKDMVGVPSFVLLIMPLLPWIWRKLVAVAHTLPYDAAVMREFKVPRSRFASVKVPSLVMYGSKTDARLKDAAKIVAGAIPGAQHRELPGQTHNVNPNVLAQAATEFLR